MAATARREQSILTAVQRYGKRLFGFIRSRVRSNEDAEDILQDVWAQFSSVVDLEPINHVSAWLFRVARNRIVDRQRKKSAVPVSRILEDHDESEESLEDLLFIEPATPEDEVLRRLLWQELFKALDELPELQRQVFVWNELEGQTLQEIADRTGENIKTITSRKRYAVSKLREKLNGLQDDLSDE